MQSTRHLRCRLCRPTAHAPLSSVVLSCLEHLDQRRDLFLRNQRRPISHDLLDLRTATRKPSHCRWSRQNQRRDFFRESLNRTPVLAAHTNAQLHFRNVRIRRPCQRTMRRTHTHKLRQYLLKLKSKPLQPLPENSIRRLRFIVSIRPRVNQSPHRLETGRVTDRHLEKLRRRPPLDTKNTHAIASFVFELYRREVGNAIGRDVLVRITHLVNKLFLDRWNDDPAAGTLVLGHHERSVRRRFNNRKTNVRKIRDAAPLILAIPTRRLCATLDDMAGNGSRREPIPIPIRPTKLMNHRRER